VITRKRKRKPIAADELKDAQAGLHVRPRRVSEYANFEEFAGEQIVRDKHGHFVDPHERLERALKNSMAGGERSHGKKSTDSKTQRNIAGRYAPILAELEQRGVSLGRPYTRERREAIVAAMHESRAFRDMNDARRPTDAALIKHLQRHYKT
jgi:hypothetical protein